MLNSKYSHERAPGREHIPRYPTGFIAIRIVQLIFALIIIGLSAYGVSLLAFDGSIFIMVVGLFTLIVSIYHLVAYFAAPALFNYWAILALDIFLIIMWLSSFALLASEVAYLFSYAYGYSYYYSYYSNDLETIFASVLAAAAGLGGLEFALFFISLTIHSIMLHRHRAAGLHCMPGQARTIPGTTPPVMQQQQPPQQGYPPVVGGQQFVPQPQQQQQFVPQQQQFVPQGQQPMYAPAPIQQTFSPTPPPQQAYVQGPPVPLQQQQAYTVDPNAVYQQQQVADPLVAQQTGSTFSQPPQVQQQSPQPQPQQLA